MISVVIILKNELGVVDTINCLNEQDFKGKFEIVVVDRSTIKYPKITSKVPLRWINFDAKGKRYTIPEQRNEGVKQSKGDIVVFIDANCYPTKTWLKCISKPILKEGESIVSGLTLSKGGHTLNDNQYSKINSYKYLKDAATIALAVHKKVFNDIGNFDISFEYGSDTDFSWRAIDSGYKIRYEPKALSCHDWGDIKKETQRTILYGKAGSKLLRKHWKKRLFFIIVERPTIFLYPIIILTLPLSLFYPYFLLIFVFLILKNIFEPKPILIVSKNLVFGYGVILETLQSIFKWLKKS